MVIRIVAPLDVEIVELAAAFPTQPRLVVRGDLAREFAFDLGEPEFAAMACAPAREAAMTGRFDELIHQSTRLSIMSLLAASDWAEFSFVRDALGLSDSALSKHFSALEDVGYIVLERAPGERRRRVRVRLTKEGERAFEGRVAALRKIVIRASRRRTL